MKREFFIGFLTLFFFACDKDKEDNGLATITVTGLNLTQVQSPSGRINQSNELPNPFPPKVDVTFVSKRTGESFPVSFSSDFAGNQSTFQLPLDSYSYESTGGSPLLTTTVTPQFGGDLVVNQSSLKTNLDAVTDYLLIGFQKTNIASVPKILLPERIDMAFDQEFYYIYGKHKSPLKVEIPLSNGRYFRFTMDLSDLTNRSFYFKRPAGDPPSLTLENEYFPTIGEVQILQGGLFPETLTPFRKEVIPNAVKETSGLEWIGNRLFTINDSGNSPEIFELNPETGAVLRVIRVSNSENKDWEDLSSSPTHLFIAELGNNGSIQPNKTILRIPIQEVLTQSQVSAEFISLNYPDQNGNPDPTIKYDIEALVFWKERLHLFTKPSDGNVSQHFSVLAQPGLQVAELVESFEAPGKLTGVDASPNDRNLVFIGYETTGARPRAFLRVYPEISNIRLGSSTAYTFWLGNVAEVSQTESIAIFDAEKIKISGEQISLGGGVLTVPPRLMELDLKGIIDP